MFGFWPGNKIKVNSVWVMFWYYWTYMVAIGKKLQTNDELIRLIRLLPSRYLCVFGVRDDWVPHRVASELLEHTPNAKEQELYLA